MAAKTIIRKQQSNYFYGKNAFTLTGMPTGGACPIGGGRGPIKWEGPVGGVFAAVMPGGGAIPGGGVWFEVCEAEFVEGEGVRYSRSSSSRVTALEPGGKDGEPLAYEA